MLTRTTLDNLTMTTAHRLALVDYLYDHSTSDFFTSLARALIKNNYAFAAQQASKIDPNKHPGEYLDAYHFVHEAEIVQGALKKLAGFAAERADDARGKKIAAAAEVTARYCELEYYRSMIRLAEIVRGKEKETTNGDHRYRLYEYAQTLDQRAQKFKDSCHYMK